MGKPDAPQPPDPVRTASAATSTNVATSVANAYLNNVNQVTPTGDLTYNQSNTYSWTDPVSGQTYSIPQFTATQTLTPQGQAIQGQQEATKYNLAGMANAQSGRIAGLLSNNLDLSGAPGGGDVGSWNLPSAQTSFDGGGPINTSFAGGGDITRSYGPADNFSADRARVEDALMQRMNPQLQIEKSQLEQQLADQGIRYGSQAYADAMDNYSRQANDARWGAISQAGQEQERMTQEAGAQAAFQNQAQNQAYTQNLGAATFGNQAQSQQFQQNAAQGTFANSAIAQQLQQQQAEFNAQQAQRNQYLQEQYAARNQPINEITSLLSGSQVQSPNFVNAPQTQIPTTDVAGLINQNFNQQMGIYGQQMNQYNSLMGGILGLGAGALKMSDEREKDNVVKLGTVFATNPDNAKKQLPIYRYSYKADPASATHIGPMAQDVEKIDKRAVVNSGGRKFIKPDMVMGSILRAA